MWKLSYLDSTWKLKPRPDVEIKPEYGNVFICFFFRTSYATKNMANMGSQTYL